MGMQTSLVQNSPYSPALISSVPIGIVKQWGLTPHDKLDWTWDVGQDGNLRLFVQPLKGKGKPRRESKHVKIKVRARPKVMVGTDENQNHHSLPKNQTYSSDSSAP
jgi:hypothetical protein